MEVNTGDDVHQGKISDQLKAEELFSAQHDDFQVTVE